MNSGERTELTLRRLSLWCLIITVAISALSLIGWALGSTILTGLKQDYIPIAPSTASFFIIPGISFLIYTVTPSTFLRRISAICASFTFLIALILLISFFKGIVIEAEHLGFAELYSRAPYHTGHMSPLTAIMFIFASSGIFLLCQPPAGERPYKTVASFLGLCVSAAGFIIMLGYLHGAPLLYGRNIIPPAFPTSVAFAFLGLGIILASGSSAPIVSIFIGSSMHSRLTRAFLPVAVAFVLISDMIDNIAEYLAINTAITTSLSAIASATVLGTIVAKIAKSIGRELDRANSERDEKVIALQKSDHELHRRQIELELQNHQMRRSQSELEEARERYFDLYDMAPVGYCTVSEKGLILETNLTAANKLGVLRNALAKRPFAYLILSDDQEIYYRHSKQLFETGEPQVCELRMLRSDTTPLWVRLESNAAQDDEGKSICRVVISDITDRRQAEEQYRSIVETSLEGIWVINEEFRTTFVNQRIADMLDYTQEEILGKQVDYFIFEEDLENYASHVEGRRQGVGEVFEQRFRRKDGTAIWNIVSSRALFDDNGRFLGSYSMFTDITARKLVEAALRDAANEWSASFDSMPDGVSIHDVDHTILRVNRTLAEMLGTPADELIGRKCYNIFHGTDNPVAGCPLELARHTLKQEHAEIFETTLNKWLSVSSSPVLNDSGQLIRFVHIARNVTERKQAENILHESEQVARKLAQENELIAEIGRIISSTLNIEEVYERFAEQVRTVIPFDRIVVSTVNMEDSTRTERYVSGLLVPVDYRGGVFPLAGTRTEHVVRTKSSLLINSRNCGEMTTKFPSMLLLFGAQSTITVPLISKDKVIGILTLHAPKGDAYSENDRGLAEKVGIQIAGAIANAQLFFERIQAEEALRTQNKTFSEVMNGIDDLVYVADINTYEIIFINRSGQKIWGDARGKVCWQTLQAGLTGPCEFCTNNMLIGIDGKPTEGVAWEFQNAVNNHWYLCRDKAIYWPDGRVVRMEIASDITDRKQAEEVNRGLEERLNRAEKMEALGQLAGGVAHDLNNVLGILTGYSELLLEEVPEGSQSKIYIDKILQSTGKGAAIIQDLLTLARRGVAIADVINLNAVVTGYLKSPVFEKIKEFHPQVNFKTEHDDHLLNIRGSSIHLEKTLMNLVSNAAESISSQGEVTIRTESRYLDKPIHGYDEIKEGDYVVLIVSDTGVGVSAEDRGKIFEPFYTKKKMGRSGTGLGLSIVWGTVKDHSGYLDIQSDIGMGTTFSLYFPVTQEELIAQQEKIAIERYIGKGESVLVVDDIPEQREIASRLLTRLGYQVNSVASGEEAVKYLKNNKADILILDMIMEPGIDGLETYKRISKINLYQKAIIVSGFSETERVQEAKILGIGAYVKKPYVLEKIGVAIRDELARKQT